MGTIHSTYDSQVWNKDVYVHNMLLSTVVDVLYTELDEQFKDLVVFLQVVMTLLKFFQKKSFLYANDFYTSLLLGNILIFHCRYMV
jgi:hypothetical protein